MRLRQHPEAALWLRNYRNFGLSRMRNLNSFWTGRNVWNTAAEVPDNMPWLLVAAPFMLPYGRRTPLWRVNRITGMWGRHTVRAWSELFPSVRLDGTS